MVHAEAGGEGEIGMALVANTIMNRYDLINIPELSITNIKGDVISGDVKTKAKQFNAKGGSLTDILFAKNQFSPYIDGRYNQSVEKLKKNPKLKAEVDKAVRLAFTPSVLKKRLETDTDLSVWETITAMEAAFFANEKTSTNLTQGLNNKVPYLNHTFSSSGSGLIWDYLDLKNSAEPSDTPFAALEQTRTIGEPLQVIDDLTGFEQSTEVLPESRRQTTQPDFVMDYGYGTEGGFSPDKNQIIEQNLKAARDPEFADALKNINLDTMTTKQKFQPTLSGVSGLPSQPDFYPKFVADYGYGTEGGSITGKLAPPPKKKFKLFDTKNFTESLAKTLETLGIKEPVSRPLDKSVTQLPVNKPSLFDFNKTQLSDVPKLSRKSLAQQTNEMMARTAPDQIAFEDKPVVPAEPSSITAGGKKGVMPIVGGPDLSRLYGRGFKPEDIGTQPVMDDPSKFVFDYGYGTAGSPKVETKKKPKPAEETISQDEYKKRVKDARTEEYAKARKDADEARDSVLQQGGSVQEAFDAAQTAFTGFTPSGEMVDPNISDPFSDVPSFGAFKEGGLASKPKKTKPKKRNAKKGLGGKMAT